MKTLIKNGLLLDPANNINEQYDLLINDDLIDLIDKNIDESRADKVIDAKGCFVMPGFIDLHVHLREPGYEHKETIETGVKAAARGGFTTICAMPNTSPVVDCKEVVLQIQNKANKLNSVNVLQIGAVTKGQKGEELADIEGMIECNIPAISEDGKSVMNSNLYREAMKIAAKNNIPVFAHCEDINLVNGGVMNADDNAKRLSMRGISNAVEDIIVARDILLAKETNARLHLCHCSTKDSVVMIEQAKKEGLKVSAEVCPHHFCLTSDDIKTDDANYKMNPPLRTKADVLALIDGLKNGIIDCIATDHAPHHADEKAQSMNKAPFGIVGLETAAALTYTKLVKTNILTPLQMAEKMSYNPAKVLGIDKGNLAKSKVADIVIFDPECEYNIDVNTFESKGKNTPFDGWRVNGKVKFTLVAGKIVYKE